MRSHRWGIVIDFIEERLRVVRAVVLDDFGRIARVDGSDELCELAAYGFIELLQELQPACKYGPKSCVSFEYRGRRGERERELATDNDTSTSKKKKSRRAL